MRSRRRFHGYCPPTARKVAEVAAVGTDDDYTCGMSALTLRVGFQTAKQIHGGPLLSFDCDEASLDSCELDTTANNSPIKLPLQARLVVAEKDKDGTVPALVEEQGEYAKTATEVNEAAKRNDDSGKANSVVERLAAHENESEEQFDPVVRLFDDSDDDDDDDDDEDNSNGRNKRDTILRKRSSLSFNILAPTQSISKKSTPSVHVSFSGGETKDIDVPTNVSTAGINTSKDNESINSNINGNKNDKTSFLMFRLNYLIVTIAIMLADGLQGTHLYVLYEGYGYSVASLYCLGFLTGAITSPITGPMVDRIGRKKAALIYCALEIWINMLEQYPFLVGLIASRMVGGITTNLLSSVFETWLDTEYRKRGFNKEEYELVMRDSVVISNLAAIASGYVAHELAERMGPVGPFHGAVTCTAVALVVVAVMWTENYGSDDPEQKSVVGYLSDAVKTFRSDSKVLRVGIIQGLTTSSIQIFIFLWSPILREFAAAAPEGILGLDKDGQPAYGLIFGAFMACGVIGGLLSPFVRGTFTSLLAPLAKDQQPVKVEGVQEGQVRPMAVEFLAALCYVACACLLLTPCLVGTDSTTAFSTSLTAFLVYEVIIGVYMPCEGVIRSLYIPSDARCSLLTLPRIIVNVCVSVGVILTRFVSLSTAYIVIACFMIIAAGLQLSLISSKDWESLSGKTEQLQRRLSRSLSLRSLTTSIRDETPKEKNE